MGVLMRRVRKLRKQKSHRRQDYRKNKLIELTEKIKHSTNPEEIKRLNRQRAKLLTWEEIYASLGLDVDDKQERREKVEDYEINLNTYIDVFGDDFKEKLNEMFINNSWKAKSDTLIKSGLKIPKTTVKYKLQEKFIKKVLNEK